MSDYESTLVRKEIRVYGQVQGVGFRYRTQQAAQSVRATGWVKNEPDGSVLMEIQGSEAQIDQVFVLLQKGRYISIEDMKVKRLPLVEDENEFHIKESMGDFWGFWRK